MPSPAQHRRTASKGSHARARSDVNSSPSPLATTTTPSSPSSSSLSSPHASRSTSPSISASSRRQRSIKAPTQHRSYRPSESQPPISSTSTASTPQHPSRRGSPTKVPRPAFAMSLRAKPRSSLADTERQSNIPTASFLGKRRQNVSEPSGTILRESHGNGQNTADSDEFGRRTANKSPSPHPFQLQRQDGSARRPGPATGSVRGRPHLEDAPASIPPSPSVKALLRKKARSSSGTDVHDSMTASTITGAKKLQPRNSTGIPRYSTTSHPGLGRKPRNSLVGDHHSLGTAQATSRISLRPNDKDATSPLQRRPSLGQLNAAAQPSTTARGESTDRTTSNIPSFGNLPAPKQHFSFTSHPEHAGSSGKTRIAGPQVPAGSTGTKSRIGPPNSIQTRFGSRRDDGTSAASLPTTVKTKVSGPKAPDTPGSDDSRNGILIQGNTARAGSEPRGEPTVQARGSHVLSGTTPARKPNVGLSPGQLGQANPIINALRRKSSLSTPDAKQRGHKRLSELMNYHAKARSTSQEASIPTNKAGDAHASGLDTARDSAQHTTSEQEEDDAESGGNGDGDETLQFEALSLSPAPESPMVHINGLSPFAEPGYGNHLILTSPKSHDADQSPQASTTLDTLMPNSSSGLPGLMSQGDLHQTMLMTDDDCLADLCASAARLEDDGFSPSHSVLGLRTDDSGHIQSDAVFPAAFEGTPAAKRLPNEGQVLASKRVPDGRPTDQEAEIALLRSQLAAFEARERDKDAAHHQQQVAAEAKLKQLEAAHDQDMAVLEGTLVETAERAGISEEKAQADALVRSKLELEIANLRRQAQQEAQRAADAEKRRDKAEEAARNIDFSWRDRHERARDATTQALINKAVSGWDNLASSARGEMESIDEQQSMCAVLLHNLEMWERSISAAQC